MPFDLDWNYFQESPLPGRPPEFVMEMFHGLPLRSVRDVVRYKFAFPPEEPRVTVSWMACGCERRCSAGNRRSPIGAYHQLWRIEKTFRMSKHDLRARPIYHHKRESIEAHLTIVFAALAVTRFVENATGWSIKRFVRTARRYRTVQIRVGAHSLTAEDPLPPDLRDALAQIN